MRKKTHRQRSETDGAVAAESQGALRPWEPVETAVPAPVAGDSGPGGVTDAPAQKDASKRARGPVAVAGFAPHKHPDYPDGPDLDPMLGARTPAFVAWLKQGTRTNF